MLVLSRKLGEKIQIGETVTISVVKIQGNRITLGVEAPADVRVRRAELLETPLPPPPDSPTNKEPPDAQACL